MREMKDSGIEWIGKIPSDWKLLKGKFIFTQRNLRGNSIELQLLSPTQKYGVIPQTVYEELSGMNTVKLNEKADLSALKTIHKGDFCISLRSFQGGFEYSDYEGVVSPAYQVFYPIVNVARGYYKYLFKEHGFIEKMNSYTMTLRDGKNIAFADFGNTYIPYPPVDKQQTIADYLDEKCAEIDELAEKIREQIDTLEKYKKSVITEAVTKGLNKNVPMKDSGIEWIGKIPIKWSLQPLKYMVTKYERGTSPDYTEEELTPVVNQATFSKGYFDTSNIRYSSKPAETSRGLLKKGDVLLASTGGGVLGKTYYFNEEGKYVADGHITVIRTGKKLLSKYLYYFFYVNFETFNAIMAKGSTNQTELQRDLLGQMLIPSSEIYDQQRIADYLDKKCAEIDEIISEKQEQLNVLDSYKKSTIYEYVTGKKEVPV